MGVVGPPDPAHTEGPDRRQEIGAFALHVSNASSQHGRTATIRRPQDAMIAG